MFCAPPVEAAVACGNARWGGNDRAAFPDAGGANGMAIAPCARSRAHVRRHRGAAAIDEWYRSTAPSRGVRACRLPALRFFNRANKSRRRSALAHVNC